MRITNAMMVSNTVWNINKNMERLNKAQEQEATQSKIQLPSDDPIVATRAVKYRNYVAKTEQYQKNVDNAVSWQSLTDDTLSNLGDVVKRLKELMVRANNSTLNSSDLSDINTEVTQLKQQAIDCMNTSYAGRYIFGGYATDKAPYELTSTAVGEKVLFKGQQLSLGGAMDAAYSDADILSYYNAHSGEIYQSADAQRIQYNIGFGSSLAVNVEGQTVTGQGLNNLFDTIGKFSLALNGATSYKTVTSSGTPPTATVKTTNFSIDDLLTELDTNYNTILTAQADLGARMKYIDMTKGRLADDNTNYTKLKSNNEDMDVAEATTNVSTAKAVYEASLSVGASIISKSLVDYLR